MIDRIIDRIYKFYVKKTTKKLIIEISEPFPDGVDYCPYFWQ